MLFNKVQEELNFILYFYSLLLGCLHLFFGIAASNGPLPFPWA
jgi:hypothetical protein